MSSTKIVIIVLVLVGVIFTVFIVRGAFRHDPPPPNSPGQFKAAAQKTEPPGWTDTIKGLFSSLQPTIELKQSAYCSAVEVDEVIPPDSKHPFRTATFHWVSGKAKISYKEKTAPPIKDFENPQDCSLPQTRDVKDKKTCSILATKNGGTFTFQCLDNAACRVEVECSPADAPRCRKKC